MSFPVDFPVPPTVALNDVNKPLNMDYSQHDDFRSLFNELTGVLQEVIGKNGYNLPHDAVEHVKRMMEYNVPKGKLNRGLAVVNTFKLVNQTASGEEIKKAAVLGWCIEWIQAAFLVADDIMDSSHTRRGQPCWFRNKEVGVIAINDAFTLLIQTEVILHKYFNSDVAEFAALHSVLIETIYQTEMGQNLDLSTQPPSKSLVDLNNYNDERYDLIVKYKTAFYSFYAPVALGLILAGRYKDGELKATKSICLKMGRYFQIQDDYLDVYGDPEIIGKIGTDIQDAKCSWLIVQALKTASPEQKLVLEQNYGKDEIKCVSSIKEVFEELNLKETFQLFEETSYQELKSEIESCDKIPKEVFLMFLNKIYKRNK